MTEPIKPPTESELIQQATARLAEARGKKPPPNHMTMTRLPAVKNRPSLDAIFPEDAETSAQLVSSVPTRAQGSVAAVTPEAEAPLSAEALNDTKVAQATDVTEFAGLPLTILYGRNFMLIPVDRIDPNSCPPRTVYPEIMLKSRAMSLQQIGQQSPIHVIPNPEVPGRFIIGDGWTRTQACLMFGVKSELLAEVHFDKTELEVAWMGYATNDEQHAGTEFDRAMFYHSLALFGVPHVEIAKMAKRNRTTITKSLSFARLPDEVLDVVRQDPARFGVHHASALAQCVQAGYVRQAAQLAQQLVDEQRTLSWLLDGVRRVLDHHRPQAPRIHRVAKQFENGSYLEKGKTFRLQLQVNGDQAEGLRSDLEAILAKYAKALPPEPVTEESAGHLTEVPSIPD